MRIAFDLGPPRQERLVLVFLRVVHLDPNVARVDQGIQIVVCGDEAVHRMAPRAPFTADVDDDPFVLPFGERHRGGDVLLRIARGIERGRHLMPSACARDDDERERRNA